VPPRPRRGKSPKRRNKIKNPKKYENPRKPKKIKEPLLTWLLENPKKQRTASNLAAGKTQKKTKNRF
jgi:hypothetical protein